MTLNDYINGAVPRKQRQPLPLGLSAVLHAAAFFLLMHAPAVQLAQSKSAYQLAIAGKETKLVWYKFENKLPAVRPPQAKTERQPVRAEIKAPQAMVASRKDAPKRKQMVWTAAPALPEAKPLDLPNILAVRMPGITRPFVAPQIKPPDAARVNVPANAPQLQTKLAAVKLTDEQRVTKKFVPPPKTVPEKLREAVAPADAPQLDATPTSATLLNANFRTPTRPFTAPPVKASPAIAKQPTIEAPPDPVANSRDLSVVVAGLNPSILPPALPANSSPGRFSAGPKVRPEGADAAGDGKALAVPDLYVAGPRDAKDIKTDLLAQVFAAPTSPMSLRAAARIANPRLAPAPEESASASLGGAVKVSGAPDNRFDGRDVYMMAIQMPNLTSWSGSWLMWYADRTARRAGESPISPPLAHRKVDPKYVASAQADGVEGAIRLACVIGIDGHVYRIEMVHGLDDRLNATAEEALSKWEFTPASRQGIPVEVDVLVEIPFRLQPHTSK